MSAFIVNIYHINTIVTHAYLWNFTYRYHDQAKPVNDRANEVAKMLFNENVNSVCYRYNEVDKKETYQAAFEDFKLSGIHASVVQILKAIHCLQYQSCEHPEWQESEAYSFLHQLENYCIHKLPGYDAAEWELVPNNSDIRRVI